MSTIQPNRVLPSSLAPLDTDTPLVSVGLATFRRRDSLRSALRSLLEQDYANLEILVHENPSDVEGIESLVRSEVNGDARVRFRRHAHNIGALGNFASLLKSASGPLFVWAADDDLADRDFVSSLLRLHLEQPGIAMATAGVRIASSDGRITGNADGFSRFGGDGDHMKGLQAYLEDPEILGKANAFYSLFRTEAIREAWRIWDGEDRATEWGGDIVLVFALLSRFEAAFIDRTLLTKGTPKAWRRRRWFAFPDDHVFPASEYEAYRSELCRVAPDAATRSLVQSIMARRRRKQIFVSTWRRPIGKALLHIATTARPKSRNISN